VRLVRHRGVGMSSTLKALHRGPVVQLRPLPVSPLPDWSWTFWPAVFGALLLAP
jgi:hypothetical protein